VEKDRTVILIQDMEPKADGSFKLPPYSRAIREIQVEESMVDDRIGLADIEVLGLIEVGHGFLKLVDKFFHGEAHGPFFEVQHDTGKAFRGLDVHILVIAQVRKLRPKWHIQGEGHLQGPVHIRVGHDRHGSGEEITGNGHGSRLA